MASKVMMKIPVTPFGQVNKTKSGNVSNEMVPMGRQSEIANRNPDQTKGSDRVAQLEQNIRFLQEQHQLMLTGLHKEIDNLRHRNRELQFQLVFVKGSVPSSPSSSSEDDTKHKVYSSPKIINITPLQIELLEKELGELKMHMHDMESQNVYLSAIVEEQKKKLERYERERERECEKAAHPDSELLKKLDDTEALLRKLHQENADLRRENTATSSNGSSSYQQQQQQQHRDSYNYYRNGQRSGGDQGKPGSRHRGGNYKGNWFPPLQTQSYWQGGRPADRNGAGGSGYAVLPNLQSGDGTFPANQYQQSRRNTNNNHYRGGEGSRKYRGGQNRGHKPS